MSDHCEPPEGAEDGSLHWLESGDPDAFVEHEAAEWSGGSPYQGAGWYFPGSQRRESPQHVAALGYRYFAPVTPPAEVARLRAEVERLTAKLADNRKGEEAVRSLKLLADMLRADGIAQHKDESNAQYVGRTLRTARADLARLVEAAERVDAAHAATLRAATLGLPDWFERTAALTAAKKELRAALAAIKERTP